MNTPTTFNELMTIISGQVSSYLNERVAGVVSLLCDKYDLSYDEVIHAIPETTNLTCPIMTKKYKKKIKFTQLQEETLVVSPEPEVPEVLANEPEVPEVPEVVANEPEAVANEPEAVANEPEVPEVQEPKPEPVPVVEPEPVLIKPKKRPSRKPPVVPVPVAVPVLVVEPVPVPVAVPVLVVEPVPVPVAVPVLVVEPEPVPVAVPVSVVEPEPVPVAVPVSVVEEVKPKRKRPASKKLVKLETEPEPVPVAAVSVVEEVKPKRKRPTSKKSVEEVVVSAILVAEPVVVEPEVPAAVAVVAQIKPKKRPAKRIATEPEIKPKKRPATAEFPKEIKISDLPSDEASWFNDMLGTSESLSPPEIKKSFFPAHPQQQQPALPPDCEVYSDDGIIDDYENDEYILEE